MGYSTSDVTKITDGVDTALVGPTGRLLVDTGLTSTVSTKNPLTAAAPTAASVSTTSAQVVASNSGRLGLVLINTSPVNISLGFSGNTAVINSGVTLTPNGVFVMDEYTFTTGQVNAVAAAESSNLSIQEYS